MARRPFSVPTTMRRGGAPTPAGPVAVQAGRPRRLEIEGLRTVAAVLVAVYHVWVGRVSGGVDVFFVVTGFLITLSLLRRVESGRVDPVAYFGQLLRRLVPGAVTVLAAALLLTITLAPPALRSRNFLEIVASAFSVENLVLAANSVDYLNAEDPHTPVQHFWAMSVNAQFYVLWFLVAVAAVVLVRLAGGSARRWLAVLSVVVLVGSFAASVVLTGIEQPVAYFVSWTRFWEFALGALVALAGSRILVRGVAAGLLSWASVLVLVLCGALLPVASSFPGWIAVVPALAACALLVSTREREVPWAATRLLAWRPVSWLGSMAFGIYLWHWPLLIAYRYVAGEGTRPGALAGGAIILGAVALAIATHRLVELPVQRAWARGVRIERRAVVGALVAWWMVATVGGVAGFAVLDQRAQQQQGQTDQQAAALGECFGYGELVQGRDACEEALDGQPFSPARDVVLQDTGGAYECYTYRDDDDIASCAYGDEDAGLRVALVGSSHAAMLVPILADRVDELGWRLETFTGNGCIWTAPSAIEGCEDRLAQQEEALLTTPFDLVIVTGGGVTDAAREGEAVAASEERFERLRDAGSEVVVVADNPRLGVELAACAVAASDADLRDGACDIPEDLGYDHVERYELAAERMPDVAIVDTRDLYCLEGTCPAVIGSVLAYRDEHHLTATYIETIGDELVRRITHATR